MKTLEEVIARLMDLDQAVRDLQARAAPRTWVEIADTLLSGSVASIDFQSIPQNFRHLRLIGLLRTDRVATTDGVAIRMNNDSGTNYIWLYGTIRDSNTLATVDASGGGLDVRLELGPMPGASAPSNHFGSFDLFIPHYTLTSAYKAAQMMGHHVAVDSDQNIYFNIAGGTWQAVSAINRLTLIPTTGPNFVAGSRVTLYGLG